MSKMQKMRSIDQWESSTRRWKLESRVAAIGAMQYEYEHQGTKDDVFFKSTPVISNAKGKGMGTKEVPRMPRIQLSRIASIYRLSLSLSLSLRLSLMVFVKKYLLGLYYRMHEPGLGCSGAINHGRIQPDLPPSPMVSLGVLENSMSSAAEFLDRNYQNSRHRLRFSTEC